MRTVLSNVVVLNRRKGKKLSSGVYYANRWGLEWRKEKQRMLLMVGGRAKFIMSRRKLERSRNWVFVGLVSVCRMR